MGRPDHRVDRITGSAWYRKYIPPTCGGPAEGYQRYERKPHRIEVLPGQGRRSACGGYGHIKLPIWSRYRLVILHEIAHCLQTERPAHGRQFAAVMLDPISRWVGAEEADAVRRSFRKARVRYTADQALRRERCAARVWSPEERSAWKAKLDAARAAKKAARTAALTARGGDGTVEQNGTAGGTGGA